MPEARPDRKPPTTATEGAAAKPRELTAEERATAGQTGTGGATAPSFTPSGPATSVASGPGATTWQSDTRVSALWSINQDRNAYMYTWNHSTNANLGWVKLSTASESGFVALDMLAANAKATQTRLDYRQESDGMVHEMYLW